MSDLQCPAHLVLLATPDPADAETLRHDRVAAVYDGPPGSGAAALAEALGLPLQVMAHPLVIAGVLAQAPEQMTALGGLADLHRGETVVVAAEGRPGQRVDVTVDGDGVALTDLTPEAGR
jgi:hypothetical protein